MAKKTTAAKTVKNPSISKEEFLKAQPLPIAIGGTVVGQLVPRQFESGSWGYNFNGAVTLNVEGKLADFQASANFTVKYSKQWAEANPDTPEEPAIKPAA